MDAAGGIHVEDAVDTVINGSAPLNDCFDLASSLDGHSAGDVQISLQSKVFILTRDCQRVYAGGDDDGIHPPGAASLALASRRVHTLSVATIESSVLLTVIVAVVAG